MFRVLGFRVLEFRGLGFRGLGFRVYVLGMISPTRVLFKVFTV